MTSETEKPALRPTAWLMSLAGVGAAVWFVTFAALWAGSQFYTDDLLYLQIGVRDKITLPWLAQNSYGHFAPVFRLIYAFVGRLGGVSWPLAAAVLATLLVLLYLALAWFTSLMIGRRPLALVIAVAGATSVPALRTTLWMASGVQVIGGALCMAFCIAGFIAYLKSGRPVALVGSVLALSVGLVWQERPVLTIGYLVLIRYLFFAPPWTGDRRRIILREILLWVPYVVVTTIYLIYRLFIFNASPAPGTVGSAWSLFTSGLVRSYFPSLVGIRLGPDAGWFEPASFLGAALLISAFTALALTRRGVWRCLVFLAGTYVANVVVQAAGRLGVPGADPIWISRDLQYFVDPYLATLFALCLGVQLPRRGSDALRRGLGVAAVATAGVVALVTAVSWAAIVRNNAQTGAHQYLNRAIAELQAGGKVDLVSLKVPSSVAFSFVDPFTDQKRFLSIDKDLARHFDPTSPRKVAIISDGSVVPAHPVTLAEAVLPAQAARPVAGTNMTLTATPAGVCMSGGANSAVRIGVPAHAPVPNTGIFQLTYSSAKRVTLQVFPYTKNQRGNDEWPSVLRKGQDRTVVGRLDGEPGDGLIIVSPRPVTDLCIRDVWIGMLAVDTPDGCRVIDHLGFLTAEAADCSTRWPARKAAAG